MTGIRVGVVVEGQGDQLALPPLIRRLAGELGRFDLDVANPFRVKRGRFNEKFDDYERALQFLARQCDVIFVILDADDDCPVELAGNLLERAGASIGHVAISVVAANREFEAWLLAGVESLRGYRGVVESAECPDNVEEIRGAKGKLEALIESGVYSETVDQVKLACRIDITEARQNSPSFDKFVRDAERLLTPSDT